MQIETEHTPVQTATHALIDYSFQHVDREEGFIVLAQETSEYDFLQVDFEAGSPLAPEYQEATEKKLYRCARAMTLEEVRNLFHYEFSALLFSILIVACILIAIS